MSATPASEAARCFTRMATLKILTNSPDTSYREFHDSRVLRGALLKRCSQMTNGPSEERLAVGWPVQLRTTGSGVRARTVNLGPAGMMFVCKERFRRGERVQADIQTAPGVFFRCTLRILEERLDSVSGFRTHSAEIVPLTPVDQGILRQALSSIRQKSRGGRSMTEQ